MKYLSQVERKQRKIDFHYGFTFEYTVDLTGETLVHTPEGYTQEMLCQAISNFTSMFMITTLEKLDKFVGFDNVKFKIN